MPTTDDSHSSSATVSGEPVAPDDWARVVKVMYRSAKSPGILGITGTGVMGGALWLFDKLPGFDKWPSWAQDRMTAVAFGALVIAVGSGWLAVRMANQLIGTEDRLRETESGYHAFKSLHRVIHSTRDKLFTSGGKKSLKGAAKKDRQTIGYDVIDAQLAHVEAAMDALSGLESSVCIKMLKQETSTFITLCTSPRVSTERRQKSTPLPMDKGLAHQVRIERKICVSQDIRRESTFYPPEHREQFSKRYNTVVACPIVMNHEVVGMLCVDWKEPNAFKESMYEPLACFTDVLSSILLTCEAIPVAPKHLAHDEPQI